MDTGEKLIAGFLILLTLVVVLGGAIGATMNVNLSAQGRGQKIGQVVKLTHEGFACKTWEAQLIRGGMNGGSGSFGTVPFDFTVPESLVSKCQEAMEKQTEVVIQYHISALSYKCSSASDGAMLDSIEPAPTK